MKLNLSSRIAGMSILALFAFAANAKAVVVIDRFTTSQTVTLVEPSPTTGSVAGPNIIGGTRTVILNGTDFDIFQSRTVGPLATRRWNVDNGGGSASDTSTLQWDAAGLGLDDGLGLSGYDLTQGGQWNRIAIGSQNGSAFPASLALTMTDALNNSSTIPATLLAGVTTTLYFNYTSFSGIDMTRISSIQFTVVQPSGSGSFYNFLETSTDVPEPGTFALMGIVMAAGAAYRRFRKPAAAVQA